MARTTSSTQQDVQPTADDFRAYADQMAANPGLSFNDWFTSPAGQAQRTAFADQQKAAARATIQSAVRAVWRDIKNHGEVTTYSGARAKLVLDMLTKLDFDKLPEPTTTADPADTTDDAKADDAKADATE